jgi:hypothetical protein
LRLIKTISLEFREGKSDKVYEVDLCEVGPDRFVVNFRYGRRGAKLQSGSKTAVPVARDKAERIYDDLVREKVDKGYHEPGAALAAAATAPAPAAAPADVWPADAAAQREAAILVRLRAGVDARFTTGWKVSRVIWRAGELRIRAAEPLLWSYLRGEEKPPKAEPPAPSVSDRMPTWSPWTLTAAQSAEPTPSYFHRRYYGRSKSDKKSEEMAMRAYCAAWALGRCSTAESIPRLHAFAMDPESPAPARRIALESIRLLMTPGERAETARQVLEGLPRALAGPLKQGETAEFIDRLRAAIDDAADRTVAALLEALPTMVPRYAYWQGQATRLVDRVSKDPQLRAALRESVDLRVEDGYGVLADLYWADDERSRAVLLTFLRSAPLGPNLVRIVRYLFKVAELRDDAEMLGLLIHRIETTRPSAHKAFDLVPFGMLDKSSPYPLVPGACTGPTRKYLGRRAWRILLDRGRLGGPEYVRIAEQVLRHFSDGDAVPVFTGGQRLHGWGKTGGAAIDRFGTYYVFNRILYSNSPRYQAARGGFFVCKGKSKPGDPPPEQREEAFRELWDRAPEALLRLALESRCTPVHEFAARALRANPGFCRGLDLATVKRLAASPYEPTARLGLDQAIERFDPADPDPELVLILADSPLADARRQAEAWLNAHWGVLRRDDGLVVGLVSSPQPETRAFARGLLRRTALPEAKSERLVARLVARLLALGPGEDPRAADIAETMLLAFRPVLRRIGEPVIRDLLAHPLPLVQRLAGDLVLGHDHFAQQPPPDLLRALLASPHDVVRSVGVRIIDQFDDDRLKQNVDVLIWLSRHPLADLRENIRATVRRLAAGDREFGCRIAGRLAESLLVPGASEGVPSHIARVLREDLRDRLDGVPAETVLRLLESRSKPAQEIGGLLLPTNVDWETLELDQLVRLASHDILSVREAVWQIGREHPDRLAADLRTAYRLADAKWEDSRRWAFALFRDRLAGADWPPEALIGLCDSVRPDVQQFGREMIGRLFREEHGERYALDLSEHPDADMQAFAGHFLDQFTADDPVQVRRLHFFCMAVLTRVNKGRVAKERAFAFLERAARAGPEAAEAVAAVLGPVSATAAISDRARAIELMTFIHETYPHIEQPIRVRPVEVRHAV